MREGRGERKTMALVTEESLPLVEPVPIDDELCSGLALIEDVAGVAARFVLYHTQTLYEVGATVFVVKKKIVMPLHGDSVRGEDDCRVHVAPRQPRTHAAARAAAVAFPTLEGAS
jgi:hypothetical protein